MHTFLKWVATYPELRKAYDAAKLMSAYVMEEEALDIARGKLVDPGSQNSLRAATLAVDQLRWSATRRDPKSYSDKGNQAIVVPIHINTSLDLGAEGAAGQGTVDFPDIYALSAKTEQTNEAKSDTVDAEFTEVPRSDDTVGGLPDASGGFGELAPIFNPETFVADQRREVSDRFEARRKKLAARYKKDDEG